jgi:hypothetical protein
VCVFLMYDKNRCLNFNPFDAYRFYICVYKYKGLHNLVLYIFQHPALLT